MELTWVAILASVTMAVGAVCVFIFAVKRDYFHNIEDAKYQVFWSDLEEPAIRYPDPIGRGVSGQGNANPAQENNDANGSEGGREAR
jgi:hypothetical protein